MGGSSILLLKILQLIQLVEFMEQVKHLLESHYTHYCEFKSSKCPETQLHVGGKLLNSEKHSEQL